MMPETTHQTAALIEKVDAAGLSALAGSIVAIPIPAPSIVSRTWTTSATITPAKIAPHAVDHDGVSVVVDGGTATCTGPTV
jgi:hypothetical protein